MKQLFPSIRTTKTLTHTTQVIGSEEWQVTEMGADTGTISYTFLVPVLK